MADIVIDYVKPNAACFLPTDIPQSDSNPCEVFVQFQTPDKRKVQLVFGYHNKAFRLKSEQIEVLYFLRQLAKDGLGFYELFESSIRFQKNARDAYQKYQTKHRISDPYLGSALLDSWKTCVNFILVGNGTVDRLSKASPMEKKFLKEQLVQLSKQPMRHSVWQHRTHWLLKKLEN